MKYPESIETESKFMVANGQEEERWGATTNEYGFLSGMIKMF